MKKLIFILLISLLVTTISFAKLSSQEITDAKLRIEAIEYDGISSNEKEELDKLRISLEPPAEERTHQEPPLNRSYVEIGTGTTYGTSPAYYGDFANYWENVHTQTLYLSSELGGANTFTHLQWEYERLSEAVPNYVLNVVIKIQTTTDNALTTGAYYDMTGATTVWTSATYVPATAVGWADMVDITDYVYDGTSNLIIDILWGDNGVYASPYYRHMRTDGGVTRLLIGYADSETPPNYDGASNYYANIRFHYTGATPLLFVSPNSYDFGAIDVDSCSVWQTFTLSNIGADTINVSSITLTGVDAAHFAMQNVPTTPFTLPPSDTLQVQFCPTTAGLKTANLTIADDRATTDIPLTGETYPENDSCAVAETIGEVTDQYFNTTYATTSGFDTHSINQDIWYVYTASANGLLDVDLCGSSFDTKLAIYEECDVGTELGYNDDSSYCDTRSAQSAILDIPVVNGEDYMIQVGGYGSNSGVGDITIVLDTCPAPDSCATTNIWQTTADLSWYEYGSTTTWHIEIDTTGFAPTGIPTYTGVSNPYTVINLIAETDYDWYVVSDCGADSSAWVGPNSFTTLAACPNPSALTETDIGPDQADLGWTQTGGITTWEIEIDTTGFTPTGIATYAGVTANPFTATGLLNETSYEWYVRADCGGGTYSAWVGPGSFTTLVECPSPTSPTTLNITATTADLDWTDGWAETEWIVEWDTTGFIQGTGTMVTPAPTSHPVGLTLLTPNTSYDWYVRALCVPGLPPVISDWVGPITFTTLCAAFIPPFSETFDDAGLPDCWTMTGSENWLFSTGAGYGAASAGDHTPGGGTNYAWIDGSGGIGTNELLTPLINVSGLTVPMLEFYLFSNNTNNPGDNNTLYVDFWDGAAWNASIYTWSGDNPSWFPVRLNLSTYTITGDVQFRFIVTETASTAFYNDILIDDVFVDEFPLCPDPTALYTDTITDSTANLNWTANGTETYWNVEYDTTGFVQGTGTLISTNTNPYSLTGLSAVTTYDWYVQADCSTTRDSSAWVGPETFATTGSYPLPYSQDFATWLPTGWTTTGGTNWGQGLGNSAGGTAPEALFSWSPGTTATQRLISPTIDTQGETSINVEFKHYLDNYGGPFTIMLQTTSDGGVTWNTTSFNHVDPVGNIGPEFQSIIVNNADVGSENFQCAFVFDGYSFNLDNWYVDDVEVIVSPPATLAITPSSFDFGDIPTGRTPTQTFTLSNSGVGTVTVNSASDITVAAGHPEFTIVNTYFSNTPAVIPSDTVTVEVQFAPTAATSDSTILSVVWTGAMRSVTDATIYGTGCTPVPNDDCVNATAVSGPYPASGSGSNECAWIDCPGLLDWYTVWYEIDLPYECQDVEITICAADTNTVLASVGIILMDDCACDDYIVRQDGLGAGWITCASGAQGYNMIFPSISGYSTMLWPAYLIDANGGVAFTYEIDVTPCTTPNAPQDVSVAVTGSIVTVSWTYHTELTYTVYSDTDPYGTFTNVEGSGIAADHLDITPIPGVPTFYRVTCDNVVTRTRTYSDGIGIIELAPKVIAPNRERK